MKTAIKKLPPTAEFALVIGMAFGLPIGAAIYFMSVGGARITASNRGFVQLWVFEGISLCLVASLLRIRGWSLKDFAIDPSIANTLRGIALLVASILAYWVAMLAVCWFTGSFDFTHRVRLRSTASLPFVVVTSLVNPFFEESFVVAYVLRALRSQGAVLAVGASAIIRLVYHLYEGPLAIVGVLPLGVIFAAFYWRRPFLWPLIIAHALGDLIGLVATAAAT